MSCRGLLRKTLQGRRTLRSRFGARFAGDSDAGRRNHSGCASAGTRAPSSGEEGVIASPYGRMEFPKMLLHECIYENFPRFEDRIAVECGKTGRKYTYRKLRADARILAASMRNKLKLNKGDVVAVFLTNVPEFPVLLLASSEAGLITTTINSTYKHEEIARQLIDSECKAIFTLGSLYPTIERALAILKRKLPVIVVKGDEESTAPQGAVSFGEFLDSSTCGDLKDVDSSPDDIVVLPYSSGTTGFPKGVGLTHRNLVTNIFQMNHVKGMLMPGNRDRNVVLGVLPMFHIYGMVIVAFSTLQEGAKIAAVPKFEPASFMEAIVKQNANLLYIVPPIVLFLLNHPLVKSEHLKNVDFIVSGASPCGGNDFDRLRRKAANAIVGQGYGMTETSPLVSMFSRERAHKLGSTGVPVISTEVKIVDPETTKPQTAGGVGELWVRGPQVMKGYWKNPGATSDMITQDGWLKTGDLAYCDEEGDLFISDRIKDLIKVKGLQVAPAELEEILRSHPKIAEAAVVGIVHPTKGEVPKAHVVLKIGEKATEDEIKSFVKEKVARHKELEGGVVITDSIPKSASGKILKRNLK